MHKTSNQQDFSPDQYRDAAAAAAAIESGSKRHETPCGAGHMVWRRWGNGPPVVLIHGGGGSWTHWIRNIAALSGRHSVWALDIPGLGDSAMPEPLSVESIVDAVERGMRTLIPGDELVDVVGFSFGTSISTVLAARLKNRLRNLVLVAARFALDPNRVRTRLVSWKNIDDPAARLVIHQRNLEILMMANPGNIDALAVCLQAANTERARYSGRRLVPGQNEKMHEYLPQVRAQGRVMGISGSEDVGSKSVQDRQESALHAIHPDGRYFEIENAGHWVQYEVAEQFNELLLDVLAAGKN